MIHEVLPKEEKIVFLDLDGVLNTAAESFDANCVENLRKFIDRTGAKIVISSSWRIFGEDYLQNLWREKNLPGEVVGVTPFVDLPPDNLSRGHEIKAWIDCHDVRNYVIIDDDNEMLLEQQPRLVLTDGWSGLAEKNIIKAINIINMREPKCYENESKWRQAARKKQSDFRIERLQCDCGPNPKRKEDDSTHYYGNILLDADAERGMNFVECYREEIADDIRRRYQITADDLASGAILTSTPLTNNLLRSEHIPYNLFFPMSLNKVALAELLREILKEQINDFQIKEVTEVRIEWPTVSRSESNPWTGDHTAFDVYIQYKDEAGNDCGIGIEVKYTEGGYKIGDGEIARLADESSEYHLVTERSGCFNIGEGGVHQFINDKDGIRNDHYRQMWRNHILGLAMTQKEVNGFRLHKFISLHLYPEWNLHFHGRKSKAGKPISKGAVKGYQELLSEKGKQTFCAVTFEKLFEAMKEIVFDSEHDAEWKEYLEARYLIKG